MLPVYIGDVVTDEGRIMSVEPKEKYDIVTIKHTLINQNEDKVYQTLRKVMYQSGTFKTGSDFAYQDEVIIMN